MKFALAVAAAFVAASNLTSAEESKEKPLGPRETVLAYVDAATNGRIEEAAKLGEPGQTPSQPKAIKENFSAVQVGKFAVKSVHADASAALAISSDVKDDRDRKGPLVFTLAKKDDRWLIRDIDLESAETAKDELQRFLERRPDAKLIPDSGRQANRDGEDGGK